MVSNRQPHYIPDIREYPDWVDTENNDWIRAHLAAPINLGGEVIGFLSLDDPEPNSFTDLHAAHLQAFAD